MKLPQHRPTRSRTALRAIALASVMSVVGTACGGSPALPGTIEPQDPEIVAVGAVLYEASCAACHGSDLRGTDLGPSHLSVVYEPNHHSDVAFSLAIKVGTRQHHWGFGAMASVEGLSDEDVEAIIAFVRENQRTEGFEPFPP